MLRLRNEKLKSKSIWRAAVSYYCPGGGAVPAGLDPQLLAGLGFPGRVFRLGAGDHLVPDEKRSTAFGAARTGRPSGREGKQPKDHPNPGLDRIYRGDRFSGTRPPLRLVEDVPVCGRGRGYSGGAGAAVRIFRVQRKHFYLGGDRSGERAENHIDRALRTGASPDVHRSAGDAAGRAAGAGLVVGAAHDHPDHAGDRMETAG